MSTTIEDRVALVLRDDVQPYGYWTDLARATGVEATRWRKVYARTQRPTPDMIQALCRLKPEYAFWIATGITDAENGHTAPSCALTFPEMPRRHWKRPEASKYFRESLALSAQMFERFARSADGSDASPMDAALADDEYRFNLVKRDAWEAEWHASNALLGIALDLTASEQYQSLSSIQEQREQERAEGRKEEIGDPARLSPSSADQSPPDRMLGHIEQHALHYKVAQKKR